MAQQFPKLKKTSTGFTLVELLIVIAVIGILIALGATAYSSALRAGRNAQRQADLGKIASALQAYYADHNFYPGTNSAGGLPAQFQDLTWIDSASACLVGGTTASSQPSIPGNFSCIKQANGTPIPPPYNAYLSGSPIDPNLNNYYYGYASDGQTYALVTQCYEGNPPADHQFNSSNLYWNSAQQWSGFSGNSPDCHKPWGNQYVINWPQH